jgi:hypothetical protein
MVLFLHPDNACYMLTLFSDQAAVHYEGNVFIHKSTYHYVISSLLLGGILQRWYTLMAAVT